MPGNLYDLPNPLPNEEQFTDLIPDRGIKIERIVSAGQITPEEEWYDQDRDEWIALIRGEAEITYKNGQKVRLKPGDHIFIKAHEKHRVTYTSADPPSIWLAVHGRLA